MAAARLGYFVTRLESDVKINSELVIAGFESRDLWHTCSTKHNSKERLVMSSDMIAVSMFSSTNLFIMTPSDNYLLQNAPLPPRNRFIIIFFFRNCDTQNCILKQRPWRAWLHYRVPRFQLFVSLSNCPVWALGARLQRKLLISLTRSLTLLGGRYSNR